MIFPAAFLQSPDFGLTVEAVLARPIPPRTRSLIRIDPVEAEIIRGQLKPEKPWVAREVTGWKTTPSGYVWFRVASPKKQTLQLNVSGASMAYVNGEPRLGDVYGYGTFFVPVTLKQGMNDILVFGFRGDATLTWRRPEAEIELDRFDATLPDFRTETNSTQGDWGGFVVRNNSERPRTVQLYATRVLEPGKVRFASRSRLIPPLGTIKIPIRIPHAPDFNVVLKEGEATWANKVFTLQVRKGGEPYRRTFLSGMDGSAQYYAVNPSSSPNPKVVVLSLHGASVEAIGQAQAYGQKDFCDIICPTNRRPFGFNWEGIGRKDALEVLADARSLGNYDPDRVMLTGHSMGGHGTWHLGSHYPNLFAAIGACAGWISFDTYAGGAEYVLKDPLQKLLARGNNPSNPLLLKENFAGYQPVFIHHGASDETVPVTEARRMRDELKGFAKVVYSEVEGGGHWFDNDPAPGADSVDWKPMFDLFRVARKPDPKQKGHIELRTFDADINADFSIGRLLAQATPFELTTVKAGRSATGWNVITRNAARIQFAISGPTVIDGQALHVSAGSVLSRTGNQWVLRGFAEPTLHGATAAYDRDVQWAGPWLSPYAQENGLWSLARFHLEQLWYRANATPEIVDVRSAQTNQRNYWNYVLIDAKQDRATMSAASGRVGRTEQMKFELAGYSKLGVRLLERFPLLSPGVSYPDWFATDMGLLQGRAHHTQAAYFNETRTDFMTLVSSDHFPEP